MLISGVFGPSPERKTSPSNKIELAKKALLRHKTRFLWRRKIALMLLSPTELPVLVFIHGESWSWGSARWITRIVTKPVPIWIRRAKMQNIAKVANTFLSQVNSVWLKCQSYILKVLKSWDLEGNDLNWNASRNKTDIWWWLNLIFCSAFTMLAFLQHWEK